MNANSYIGLGLCELGEMVIGERERATIECQERWRMVDMANGSIL